MPMLFLKIYRGDVMKFVNKLSVISLLVLMFSFANFAHARTECQGSNVSFCNQATTQAACESTYRGTPTFSSAQVNQTVQCKWTSNVCSGQGVSFCNASTTKAACEGTYRTTSPTTQCAWDGSICRANGAACASTASCSASGTACYVKGSDCSYKGGALCCHTSDNCEPGFDCNVANLGCLSSQSKNK